MPKTARGFADGFLEGLGSPGVFVRDALTGGFQLQVCAPLKVRRRPAVSRRTSDWTADLSAYLAKFEPGTADSVIGAKPSVRIRTGR